MSKHLIDIIIPSWNNFNYLQPCLQSILRNNSTVNLFHIWVVNNGEPESVKFIDKDHPIITVLNPGKNLGWEGGINFALEQTDAPFVVFCNDDTHFPASSRFWLHRLLRLFDNPQVGAVGPSSNVVMGMQNIFIDSPYDILQTNFLIGYCMMVRREALDTVGYLDEELPGGDDLDVSIRLRKASYKLLIDRTTFVYHHGFKSGTRLVGDYWNSITMTEKTNFALIRKHGFASWVECLYGTGEGSSGAYSSDDTEGDIVRQHVKGSVLELGVGGRKTVPEAIGVDMIPNGEVISTLSGDQKSVADIIADVSAELPVEDESFDTIIARHVLEHVTDTVKTMTMWKSKLKPGGLMIVAVPDEDLHATIPLNVEHKHAYTQESLKRLMELMDFKTITIEDSRNYVGFVGVFQKENA